MEEIEIKYIPKEKLIAALSNANLLVYRHVGSCLTLVADSFSVYNGSLILNHGLLLSLENVPYMKDELRLKSVASGGLVSVQILKVKKLIE